MSRIPPYCRIVRVRKQTSLTGIRLASVCRVLLALFLTCAGVRAGDADPGRPVPSATPGLLLHVSFDGTRVADFAAGNPKPDRLYKSRRWDDPINTGTFVPGVFGQALRGVVADGEKPRMSGMGIGNPGAGPGGAPGVAGHYRALGNILPDRGTVAFWIRKNGFPYGFAPFNFRSVDFSFFYWNYLRIVVPHSNNSLDVHLTDERAASHMVSQAPGRKGLGLANGQWHHLAVAYDHAYGVRFYLDGELHADNWGLFSWNPRAVDPDFLALANDPDAEYDELYVFDRPLSAGQIGKLIADNAPPTTGELEPVAFDDARRAARQRELSWEDEEPLPLRIAPGEAVSLRQILPAEARAVRKNDTEVFDGKLGTSWPMNRGYEYNCGNGLHVRLTEDADYLLVEGGFSGMVYPENGLLENPEATKLAQADGRQYMTRHALPEPMRAFSFFNRDMRLTQTDEIDGRSSTVSEVNFYKLNAARLDGCAPRRFYLRALDGGKPSGSLGTELYGRYPDGDRLVCGLAEEAQKVGSDGNIVLPALRYVHLLALVGEEGTYLCGLRLHLAAESVADDALRIELRHPFLPQRRPVMLDVQLGRADNGEYDLTLDSIDQFVQPGQTLWLTLSSRDGLALKAGGASYVEFLFSGTDRARREYVDHEANFVKMRFQRFTEPRPWGKLEKPEEVLPRFDPAFGELFVALSNLRKIAPDDPRVSSIWDWTHKFTQDVSEVLPQPVEGCKNAPEWALLQRELLGSCRGIYDWWIENRQTPNGEFGESLGDDSDLVQDFLKPALLKDPDGRLREAVIRIADLCWQERMENGINLRTTDHLHAYEEGMNANCAAAMIRPHLPKYLERLMVSCRTVRDFMTVVDAEGHRHFPANWYGSRELMTKGSTGVDIPSNALMLHPALVLAWQTRHPDAIRLIREYLDGWLAHWNVPLKKNGRRLLPVAKKPDGTVTARAANVSGYGFEDLFLAMLDLKGDKTYNRWDLFLSEPSVPQLTGSTLCFFDFLDRSKHGDALREQARTIRNETLPFVMSDRFGDDALRLAMLAELGDGETDVLDALRASLRNVRRLITAYTWAEPNNDRIWPPDHAAVYMALGGIPYERNQLWPRHRVDYNGFSDFAAWVDPDRTKDTSIRLYNFSAKEEMGSIRFWRERPGRYRVEFNGQLLADGVALYPGAKLTLALPARQESLLLVMLLQEQADDPFLLPDLASEPSDITQEGEDMLVRIHNLGNIASLGVMVLLRDEAGREFRQTAPAIAAPVGFAPQSTVVRFSNAGNACGWQALIDPDGQQREITKENNRALR